MNYGRTSHHSDKKLPRKKFTGGKNWVIDFLYPMNRQRFAHSLYKDRYVILSNGEPLGLENRNRMDQAWLKDVWILDLKYLSFTYLGKTKEALSFHSQVCTDSGKLVIFGGKSKRSRNEKERRTNVAFKLQIGVPSLRELCRNALREMEAVLRAQILAPNVADTGA